MHSVQNKWPQGVSDDWSATTPKQMEHMRSWGTSSGFRRRSLSIPWLRPLPWNAGGGGRCSSRVMVWARAGRAAIVGGLPPGLLSRLSPLPLWENPERVVRAQVLAFAFE